MYKMQSSSIYIKVPITAPVGTDPTTSTPYMAIVPESYGEPLDTDYSTASWIGGKISLKPSSASLAAGEYFVYVKFTAGSEDVRLLSGKLRNGDART